ncbi:MAG: hypothetical protein K2N06_01780 [Oscillospiraceae bacterium]|nr:hypothetical protein [Oscillospiraceae bacterium]
MPKKIRLAVNMAFSLILMIVLIAKIMGMITHWSDLAENWDLNGAPTFLTLFFVFGIYPLIAVTALSVWLKGVPPIVFSTLGLVGGFALYFLETIFNALYIRAGSTLYMGFTPIVSMCTYLISFFMLVISIVELVIAKRKKF